MCRLLKRLLCVILFITISACNNSDVYPISTFGEDLEVINSVISPVILKDRERQIVVSSEFQGRIFTSTSQGLGGTSYGWFNKNILLSDSVLVNRSKIGGEGRIWFGPDQGPNTIFFKIDEKTGEKLHAAPKDLNTLSFNILAQSSGSVKLGNKLHIENLKGFHFNIEVERKIELLKEDYVSNFLSNSFSNNLSYVAYKTNTKMTNVGEQDWSKETGLLSLWDLGCYHPTPKTTVIIPLKENVDNATVYFTEIDSTRIVVKDKVLYYKADANYLNKIGTLPEYTLPYFGSYSPELNSLTIVKFSFNSLDKEYVNAHPVNVENQYRGDVINVFNDGKWGEVGPFGPFYELETSSPAKELKVGESVSHFQEVYHFKGSKKELNKISISVLGVSIKDIEIALP
ncbi:hypothetical protein CLV91_1434 [Maribacter vaceletii]|uniref:DUF4374 domain-containing protein n=1 Tax=Maribacter vaceletii TaxID=1206816 RepID=A0A495EF93_9FLAO|nr:DUF6786 family protein [Maribacter vaceletii]RKR15349.1 hypothetical protein CLV91_1434 [Maribacter vaceletii]